MLSFRNKLWYLAPDLGEIWSSTDGAQWTKTGGSIPCGNRYSFSAAVFDDKMWILGGFADHNYSDVWSSPNGVDWTRATDSAAWGPRYSAATVAFGGRLWVVGGIGPLPKNDVWSSADGIHWTLVTEGAPWAPRIGHSAVVLGDKLWVIGGLYRDNGQDHYATDVWRSPDGVNWTRATEHAGWPGRTGPVIAFDDKLWILGGVYGEGSGHTGGDVFLNDVWYSGDGVNWIQEPSPSWVPRAGHAAASFNNKLWICGGAYYVSGWPGGTTVMLNDVWCMTPVTVSVNAANGSWRQEDEALDLRMVTSGLSEPIAYQWMKNGAPLAGATTDTFRIDAVSLSDQASYTCQATDQDATVFTAEAIAIYVFPAGSLPAAGPVALVLTAAACVALFVAGTASRENHERISHRVAPSVDSAPPR